MAPRVEKINRNGIKTIKITPQLNEQKFIKDATLYVHLEEGRGQITAVDTLDLTEEDKEKFKEAQELACMIALSFNEWWN